MKQTAVNEFRDGLNLDLHPLVTPNTVLTDNLNGTFITYNGNEFCLQNDRGNKFVGKLPPGYTPIGIKEHNGVLYIVSVNGNKTEIGTYPGIDWSLPYIKDGHPFPKDENGNYIYQTLRNVVFEYTTITISDYTIEQSIEEDANFLYQYASGQGIKHISLQLFINLLNNKNVEVPIEIAYAIARNVLETQKTRYNFGTISWDQTSHNVNNEFGYTVNTPLTIEIQDSYDGSVNLILVADREKPRIINSGFSVLPNDRYNVLTDVRNQTVKTNNYNIDTVLLDTELIRTSGILTNIALLDVQSGGQFKGGNYTFYIKFGDADYNQTDVVAESGIVSIFNGNDGVPSTISGTLADERTDKAIRLAVTGLNHAYSKIYIYYSREYSDTQGYRMTEYGMFKEPIDFIEKEKEELFDSGEKGQSFWLTGFEQTVSIDPEILNIDYHTVDWARSEAQHSNMLFLGNVGQKETFDLYTRLREISESIEIKYPKQADGSLISPVSIDYKTGEEYYSTQNIYRYVGYYPGEIYRFGIVYILKDGSKTPVFNTKGYNFQNELENGKYETLKKGVVLMPKLNVITSSEIKPIYLEFVIPEINEPDVAGWFIVRQKRIPNTICEGLSIATDAVSNTPMMWDGQNWVTQSFLASDRAEANEIVQLEYNNPQSDIEINAETKTFEEWIEEKHLIDEYYDAYWLEVDIRSAKVSSSFDWNVQENETQSDLIKRAISTLIAPDETRNYSIYTLNTCNEISEEDEEISLYDQIQALKTHWVDLIWYQKYRRTSIQEQYVPEDSPVDEYIVGIVSNLKDWDDSNNINLPVSRGNLALYNSWKRDYTRECGGAASDLQRKFIQNTVSYGKESDSLLSLDPCVVPQVGSRLDGSKFWINLERELNVDCKDSNGKYKSIFTTSVGTINPIFEQINEKCVYVSPNTSVKVVDDYEFSNVAGNAADVSQYKPFSTPFIVTSGIYPSDDAALIAILKVAGISLDDLIKEISKKESIEERKLFAGGLYSLLYSTNKNINLLRGLFCPYIGITYNGKTNNGLKDFPFGIYSIKAKKELSSEDFLVRQQDNSEYYCVSEYTNKHTINVYRGDCFTNTVSMRMIRNFVDNTAPVSDIILDPDSWYNYVTSRNKEATDKEAKVSYEDVNLADVNTVDLGYWVTFKCLSSYNLGLRSVDRFHTDEMALLGSPRSFYPLNGASTATGNKVEESFLLNDGLSATVGRKRYNLLPNVPYSKSEFANRIMFSNVNVTDAFTNGYRTFQGLSYKDYDKQYGAITKLISLGQNLFVVMEHGLGLVPVNPKALMQTTTGETIHIYGYGVLPDEMTIISQDYGSKYEHSVMRTPIGIYGVDVDAKKIWRFSDRQGFETISDMKIETYLKDYLKPLIIEMGLKDIRTHYNSKKGDLIFTWNDENGNVLYSICYNERQNIWVTRYDWKPIVSENINDSFYSLNFGNNSSGIPYLSSECGIWHHADDVGYNNEQVSQWYDKNHVFEFEFVVSDPIGANKIFDNLQIISNNVQPNELEISIIGDDYMFNRINIQADEVEEIREEYDHNSQSTSNIHENKENGRLKTSPFGYYHFDNRIKQSIFTKWQPFKDIYKFGRRIGNIQYKEGSWFAQIEPLLDPKFNKEVRIRDKWAKIRIRYSGKDLAIITAIKTLINV